MLPDASIESEIEFGWNRMSPQVFALEFNANSEG